MFFITYMPYFITCNITVASINFSVTITLYEYVPRTCSLAQYETSIVQVSNLKILIASDQKTL